MGQQKQCKQLILTEGHNIFTYCFQAMQHLQPYLRLMAKGISCIPSKRRQRKINNILNHTAAATYTTEFYESYIPKNQTYKHNSINDSNDINVDFITNSKFMLLQLRQCKFNSGVFIFKLCNNLTKLVHFMHHQFCTFHRSPHISTLLDGPLRIFHSSLHESVTIIN